MAKALSEAQRAVLESLSQSRNSVGRAGQETLISLERLHIIKYQDDLWSLTDTGKAITRLVRKVSEAKPFEGLILKYRHLTERGNRNVCGHDLVYVAEQIRKVFGTMIDENPEAKAAFIDELSGNPNTRLRAL